MAVSVAKFAEEKMNIDGYVVIANPLKAAWFLAQLALY